VATQLSFSLEDTLTLSRFLLRSQLSARLPLAPFLSAVVLGSAFGCGGGSSNDDCSGSSCTPSAPSMEPPPTVTPTNTSEVPPPASTTDMQMGPLPIDNMMEPPQPDQPSEAEVQAQRLLDIAVKFYGAQRSGDGANWLLDGQSCHVGDGETIMADLSGGWYDAGDHVKVTLSIAYASYVLLKAYDAFPEAFSDKDSQRYTGAPNGVPDVLDEVRYATDYLVKAHLSETVLVGMVGNAQQDHSRWLDCLQQEALPAQNGGSPRPVSQVANADIAGITAAALASMARLYRPFDATLADTYQTHALQVYAIGEARPMGSNPGLYGQNGTNWRDEMLAGAAELYRLTNDAAYLDDALAFNTAIENHGWAPNYSQSADFSRHSLYVAGAADAVREYWRLDVANYAAKVSANQYTEGMIYIDEWASLRYTAGAAFSAALFAKATGDTAALELARRQLAYISGDNSYGHSFVVGFGEGAPEHPHHRNSDNLSVLLAGALVGGPTQRNYIQGMGMNAIEITLPGYEDDVDDYVGNEVALDYNAGLVGLAAFGVVDKRAAASPQ
jgi:endoglucanase